MKTLLNVAALLLVSWHSLMAAAEGKEPVKDIYDLTEIVAVQNRAYQFNEAFGLGGSYFPSDAFNHGYSANAFYTHSVSELFSWEVLRYNYIFNQETQTKKDVLAQGFLVTAGDGGKLDFPVHLITTGAIFTPLYNKGLLFNKRLIYGEIALYLGGGVAIMHQTGNRYLLTPGFQMRFFTSEKYALLAHFRDHFYNDAHQGINNMIDFGLAFEIRTGFLTSKDRTP